MIGTQAYLLELRRLAKQKIESARRAERDGDLAGAAEQLRAAAVIVRRMAEREVIQQDRVRLYQKANEADEKARRLAAGQRVFTAGEDAARPLAAVDEYRASVDELIYRASVTWDDIGGMEDVKSTLKYSLGMMLARMPAALRLQGASRVLLYGPPGTGKTLLAAASSNMLGATFFNVKASDLMSKYFGESTRLISALYARARSESDTGAALVFIDEFDALCRRPERRDETGTERRILSTLLAELDGLSEKGQAPRVITMAATNQPWDVSEAVLQRFERQFLVDLPDAAARRAIFRIHVEGAAVGLADDVTCEDLADRTEGYSGRDIQHVCKDAVEKMIREMNEAVPDEVDRGTIRDYEVRYRPLAGGDFAEALARCRPVCSRERLRRYRQWARTSGTAA